MEATFCVMLGYTIISLALAIYLNVLTVGNVRNAGKAVRGTVRQQLLVVKV
jgi:E3 ubiquitin-protein ligase MARCH6